MGSISTTSGYAIGGLDEGSFDEGIFDGVPALQVAGITQRKHYKEAIGVARDALARLPVASAEAGTTRELIAHTEAKFAAHLLERAGQPEAAMQHYMQTIGCVMHLRSCASVHAPLSIA